MILSGIEDSTSKSTWRYPETSKALYFQQLASWGYSLSEVEQIVITAKGAGTIGEASAEVTDDTDYDSEDLGE